MRNRAKCRLCGDIIESFARHDYVECSCREIAVDGGDQYFKAAARNFENFIRIDDEDNEVEVTVKENSGQKEAIQVDGEGNNLSRDELVMMLKQLADSIERLPPHALTAPITNGDFCALITLLHAIFIYEKKDMENDLESF